MVVPVIRLRGVWEIELYLPALSQILKAVWLSFGVAMLIKQYFILVGPMVGPLKLAVHSGVLFCGKVLLR